MPPIYKLITGKIIAVPEYYDYQWKARWYLGDHNRHPFRCSCSAAHDLFAGAVAKNASNRAPTLPPVTLPCSTISLRVASRCLMITCRGRESKYARCSFNTLIYSRFYREAPGRALGTIDVNTRPNISGLREIFDIYYLDKSAA
ncbi:MAG: hypothetical protein U1F16_06535 [Turneriella sp.]